MLVTRPTLAKFPNKSPKTNYSSYECWSQDQHWRNFQINHLKQIIQITFSGKIKINFGTGMNFGYQRQCIIRRRQQDQTLAKK